MAAELYSQAHTQLKEENKRLGETKLGWQWERLRESEKLTYFIVCFLLSHQKNDKCLN